MIGRRDVEMDMKSGMGESRCSWRYFGGHLEPLQLRTNHHVEYSILGRPQGRLYLCGTDLIWTVSTTALCAAVMVRNYGIMAFYRTTGFKDLSVPGRAGGLEIFWKYSGVSWDRECLGASVRSRKLRKKASAVVCRVGLNIDAPSFLGFPRTQRRGEAK